MKTSEGCASGSGREAPVRPESLAEALEKLRNPRQWESVDAPITNKPGQRSPSELRAVLEQFDVVNNTRYQRTKLATFCNIYSWDATRALGCEIPHWLRDPSIKKGRRELSANATLDWLDIIGPDEGWREVSQAIAIVRAEAGFPAVAIWKNPTGKSGHIAVLLPPKLNQVRIAQAGAKNLFDAPLSAGFGSVKPIRFFTHE